jgi:hypothetical protein
MHVCLGEQGFKVMFCILSSNFRKKNLNRLLEVGPIESLMIHVHVYYMVSCVVTFTLVFEMFFCLCESDQDTKNCTVVLSNHVCRSDMACFSKTHIVFFSMAIQEHVNSQEMPARQLLMTP